MTQPATLTHSERNWANSLYLPAGSPNPCSPHFNQAFFFLWFSNLEIKICTPKHRLSSALSWTNMVSVEWNHSGTRFSEKIIADFCPWMLEWVIGLHLRESFSTWTISGVCGSTGQNGLSLAATQLCAFRHASSCGCWEGAGSVVVVCAPKQWAVCDQKTLRPCRTSWMTSQQSDNAV